MTKYSYNSQDSSTSLYGTTEGLPHVHYCFIPMYFDLLQIEWLFHPLVCTYIVLFSVGCTGNIVVIFLIRRCRHLQRAPTILLINLAVADLLVCLTYFPINIFAVLYIYGSQSLYYTNIPESVCQALLFLDFQSQLCSALTIASINIERCYVLLYPLRVRSVITLKRKLLVTASIWVISILCSIHVMFMMWGFGTSQIYSLGYTERYDKWQPTTQFTIPAVIIIVSCIITSVAIVKRLYNNRLQESIQNNVSNQNSLKNTKKALKMVIVVAVVFLCMTSPSGIWRYIYLYPNRKIFNTFPDRWTYIITNVLRISNSCVNPFIYALMSSNFQSAIKSTFCCKTASTNMQNSPFNSRSRTLQNRV